MNFRLGEVGLYCSMERNNKVNVQLVGKISYFLGKHFPVQ